MANIEYLLTTAADIGEIFVLSKVPGSEKFIGGQNYVDFVKNNPDDKAPKILAESTLVKNFSKWISEFKKYIY